MKPRIVAIDTTGEFGSLALWEGESLVEEVPLHAPEGFSQILFDHLGRLLRRHGWEPASVDCWAAAAGPGSFTGVRVGLAAVKGLGEALGKPVAAVSNLQAIATYGTAPLRAVVVDARRGQIYAAVYRADLTVHMPEVVTRFSDWLQRLPREGIEFVSTDFSPFRLAVAGTAWEAVPVRKAPRALAAAVAGIAARRWQAGQLEDPLVVDANYVRLADAEYQWRDRAGSGESPRTASGVLPAGDSE